MQTAGPGRAFDKKNKEKTMKKLTISILLLAMLASILVACGGSEGSGSTTTASETTVSDTTVGDSETEGKDYTLELPEGLRFEGEEFNIATWNGGNYMDHYDYGWCNFLDCDDPEPGMLLQEAAYSRNEEIRNLLGVEITATEDIWNWNATSEGIMAIIDICSLSGTSSFDLIMYEQYGYEFLIIDELLMDVAAMPYIDLDKGYYNQKANDVYYLRENLYVLHSDIAYPCQNAVNLLINNDMLVDLNYDANYVYDMVNNGTWTFDAFSDMISGLYTDMNGDKTPDLGDKFGLQGQPYSLAYLYPAAGLKGMYLGEEGFEFDYGTDYSFEVFDAIMDLKESQDVYCVDYEYDAFKAGRALFTGYASEINQLQSWFDFAFGVLPFPKFKDTQETYCTPASGGICLVPANIENEEFVGAMIEAMAAGSRKYLVPAFYDTFVENGVLRDNASRENWKRMLNEWGQYDFSRIIAPDDRIRNYAPAYNKIISNERDFKSSWDSQKETIEQVCQEFYEWYLAE